MVKINAKSCPQNHPCPMVGRCPAGALRQRGHEVPSVERTLCLDCGDCTSFCRVFERLD